MDGDDGTVAEMNALMNVLSKHQLKMKLSYNPIESLTFIRFSHFTFNF